LKYLLLILSVLILCDSCVEPRNITTREKYQTDHQWCMTYGAHPRVYRSTINHTETYKECMEKFGYKFD